MQLDDFWDLVAHARATAERAEAWPNGSQVGKALASRLETLPTTDVLEFDTIFQDVVHEADQWELCAACFLISGYLSDDGFTDFKAGLVALGREAFTTVVTNADSLADLPVVEAIAEGGASPFTLHGESMLYAAANAYAAITGDDEEFWGHQDRDTGRLARNWSGVFGPADAPPIPARLPRLYARFPRTLATDT
jgi:hypothetical protein